jgi:hypothetical protein
MEENNCHYLDSQGIRKSCDMSSLINSDNLNDYNFNDLKQNDILYIKTDIINLFSHRISEIKCKFILVTGSSDYTVPIDRFANINDFLKILNNENVIHWYAENCIYVHPKITILPIGIDFHSSYCGTTKTPIEQEYELINIKRSATYFSKRECKIYSNCHFATTTRYGYDRIDAINNIPCEILYLEPSRIDRKSSWLKQINYAFVLSPLGNGLDCYRTWEALVLGCIPIVKTSGIDSLYIDLPVLIVNQWKDVTQKLLMDTIQDFKNRIFNYDKLTLKYWIGYMKNNL